MGRRGARSATVISGGSRSTRARIGWTRSSRNANSLRLARSAVRDVLGPKGTRSAAGRRHLVAVPLVSLAGGPGSLGKLTGPWESRPFTRPSSGRN